MCLSQSISFLLSIPLFYILLSAGKNRVRRVEEGSSHGQAEGGHSQQGEGGGHHQGGVIAKGGRVVHRLLLFTM